ncbi:MAG: toxin-antitoxin system YwqK family antitoxin [Litorivicinaceae bacterium]
MRFILLLASVSLVSLQSVGETMDELVTRDGLYYKISSDIPFSGEIDGQDLGSFENGQRHGAWVFHHENGQVKSEGYYRNGKKHGAWAGYYANGQLFYRGAYSDGKKEGLWVSYYDNAKIFYKGRYNAGKENGRWIGFNPDGSPWLYRTGVFQNGSKIGD